MKWECNACSGGPCVIASDNTYKPTKCPYGSYWVTEWRNVDENGHE